MASVTTITLQRSESIVNRVLMRVEADGESDTFILSDDDLDDLQNQLNALLKPITFTGTKWTSAF